MKIGDKVDIVGPNLRHFKSGEVVKIDPDNVEHNPNRFWVQIPASGYNLSLIDMTVAARSLALIQTGEAKFPYRETDLKIV